MASPSPAVATYKPHNHFAGHSPHSSASTPFTNASSYHSPPLAHHNPPPTSSLAYPSFSTYHQEQPHHPASYHHPQPAHHQVSYSDSMASYRNTNSLQLHPPADLAPYSLAGGPTVHDLSASVEPFRPIPPQPPHLSISMPQSSGPASASAYLTAGPSDISRRASTGITTASSNSPLPSTAQPRSAGPMMMTHPHIGMPVGVGGASPSAATTIPPPSATTELSSATGSRKRPKYTRSKAGCLVCRAKKVKCDEKHPTCTRCLHGHRECSWPKEIPSSARRGGSSSAVEAPSQLQLPPQLSQNSARRPAALRGVEAHSQPRLIHSAVDDVPHALGVDGFAPLPPMPHSAPSATQSFSIMPEGYQPSQHPLYSYQTASANGYSADQTQQQLDDEERERKLAVVGVAGSGGADRGLSHGAMVGGGPSIGPDPLGPYFRTQHERNLVGTVSSASTFSPIPLSLAPSYEFHPSVPSSFLTCPPPSIRSNSYSSSASPSSSFYPPSESSTSSIVFSTSPVESFEAPWTTMANRSNSNNNNSSGVEESGLSLPYHLHRSSSLDSESTVSSASAEGWVAPFGANSPPLQHLHSHSHVGVNGFDFQGGEDLVGVKLEDWIHA